jgi:hypothetical protein
VYRFSLQDGQLIRKYPLGKDSVFLNDITVGPDGTVYVTESVQNSIYQILPGSDSLELFASLSPYHFINGICFSSLHDRLFVSSTEGILSVGLADRKPVLLSSPAGADQRDIDGLSFVNNYFIGHQGNKVCRFYTNVECDRVLRADTLDTGKEFDGSTTGETGNGFYYFIVNSQIQSGIDYGQKRIKHADSLEYTLIRRKALGD